MSTGPPTRLSKMRGGGKIFKWVSMSDITPIYYHLVAIINPMLEICSVHVHAFFIRNHFLRKLHVVGHNLKELVLLKTKFLRKFSISNTVTTAKS